ncbi:hypothetical protein BC629DRAFT_1590764 [Irpex lacteus]|nr:hypothetical protein BC629DRAFT_1590764 [Irpex lacteus]
MGGSVDPPFLWTFGNNFVASEISECQTLPLQVIPLKPSSTFTGVGPYYMFAFEPEGIPTVSLIGSDPKNLSWQNTHKSGSSLMLMVGDSKQNTGGFSSILYNVTAGTDSSCLSTEDTQSSTLPHIKPNVTGKIQTCEQWGLTISGGKSPYQIVLSALSSPTMTNSTMSADDDVYTYVNRADPNQLLMASVVDADGKWGVSSPGIMPYGSSNVACRGRLSSSKTSAQIQQEAQDRAAAASQEKRNHQHLIVGICIAVGVVAVIALSVGLWWFMRRRARSGMGIWDSSQDYLPRAWNHNQHNNNVDMQEGQTGPRPLLMSAFSNKPAYAPLQNNTHEMDSTPTSSAYATAENTPSSRNERSGSITAAPIPVPPGPLTARDRKIREARAQHGMPVAGPSHGSIMPSSSSHSVPAALIDTSLNPDIQPDIIIQHRDGGAGIVHELPPPYADRALLEPTSHVPDSSDPHSSRSHSNGLS